MRKLISPLHRKFLVDNTKQKLEKLEASCEAMGL